MPGFVDKADEVNLTTLNLIVDIVGKGAAVFAGKTVWTDMIAAFPFYNRSHSVFDAFMQVVAKPVGNAEVTCFRIEQILFEKG
jgi:hypothetical protein